MKYRQQRNAIVTVLTCKTDPESELRYMQDLFEHRFLCKEINIKSDLVEKALESVKKTGHSTSYAMN